jgi:large subunit ribosomal protein L21
VLIGRPTLEGAAVRAEVLRHGRADKIVVFKFKRRKNIRSKTGHRQDYTEVRVSEIDFGGRR